MTADVVWLRTPLTVEARCRALLWMGERLSCEGGVWAVRVTGFRWPVFTGNQPETVLGLLQARDEDREQDRERSERGGPDGEPAA